MKKSVSPSPSPISQPPPALAPEVAAAGSSSSRRHQQCYQNVASTQERGSLFSGLYCCHDSLEHQVSSTIASSWTKTGGCTFHKSMVELSAVVWMLLYILYRFAIDGSFSQQGHESEGYIYDILCCLRCSSHSSFLHCFPPRHRMQQVQHFLLAAIPSPGRRVSGLGGPELRPVLLLHAATKMKLSVQWIDGFLFTQFWLQLTEMRFAQFSRNSVQLMKWWMKPNIKFVETNRSVIEWISRDCPLSQNLPTKRLFQISHGSSLLFGRGSRKYQTPLQFKDL